MISAVESRTALVAIHNAIKTRRNDDFVFVGGGIVPLLITDPAAAAARPTKDVDVVFEIASTWEYYGLHDTLRQAGFIDDPAIDKPTCALHFGEWRVDILSTLPNIILGGGNRWFPFAIDFAQSMEINGTTVLLASAPVFIATKLEAWVSRGKTRSGAPDYYHQDIEDVVAVVDGRPELDEEWLTAPREVVQFVGMMFYGFVKSHDFLNALPGHLSGDDQRARLFIARIEKDLLSQV